MATSDETRTTLADLSAEWTDVADQDADGWTWRIPPAELIRAQREGLIETQDDVSRDGQLRMLARRRA